jgi:hypothetical protein
MVGAGQFYQEHRKAMKSLLKLIVPVAGLL